MSTPAWSWHPPTASWVASDGVTEVSVKTPGGILQFPQFDAQGLITEKKLLHTDGQISVPQMREHGIIADRERWARP